jgi:6-phosphofructokinase 1
MADKKTTKKSAPKTKKAKEINTIAVLCSGGDSPGMNCAIRSVVRTALGEGLEVYGIQKGYAGLLEGSFTKMDVSSVGNIIQRGGTILQTSRCPDFHKKETRKEAANILKRKNVDALIVIGGDGSFNGAILLARENDIPIVGIPGTIDNDISGTEYTLGFDTAVQTAVEAVDKIRDTASSHARTFIVEVMGRKSTAIAIHVGVCTGAENIVLPDRKVNYDEIAADIQRGLDRGKNSSIIIVAEGEKKGLSYEVQNKLSKNHKIDAHVCILGHIQRGGSPSSLDRFIASKMGLEAVKAITSGQYNTVTAFSGGRVRLVDFDLCLEKRNEYELPFMEVVKALSI